MISKTYSNKILNTLLGTTTTQLTAPDYVYLGLCANEPNHEDGAVKASGTYTGANEPDGKIEDDDKHVYYARKLVGGRAATTSQYFSVAGTSKMAGQTEAIKGVIFNTEEIQMPTARAAYPEKMNYWFLSTSSTIGEAAFLWGKIKDADGNEGITIGAATVPTFYEEQLQASIDVELESTTTTEA